MKIATPALRSIEPYTPGLSKTEVVTRFGLTAEEISKLGSAENPFGASPKALAAVGDALDRLSIYPDWSAGALRETIAARYGFAANQVFCGAGETEILPWLIRVFAGPGDLVLMHEPTFPLYHQIAIAEGRQPVFVPMGDPLSFREDAFLEAITPEIRIVFLTNPHSPTGLVPDEAFIRNVLQQAKDALVVLDEAYVHFSETTGGMHLLHEFDNLVVLRTFSKVYGLAGLRIGFGIASAEIASLLLRAKPTWNLGQLQQIGAIAALGDDAHVARTVGMIAEMRPYVLQQVNRLSKFRAVPGSRANFFLLEILDPTLDSTAAFEGLLRRGVIVKDCSVSFQGLGRRYLRIDVGLKPDMDRLVAALEEL